MISRGWGDGGSGDLGGGWGVGGDVKRGVMGMGFLSGVVKMIWS